MKLISLKSMSFVLPVGAVILSQYGADVTVTNGTTYDSSTHDSSGQSTKDVNQNSKALLKTRLLNSNENKTFKPSKQQSSQVAPKDVSGNSSSAESLLQLLNDNRSSLDNVFSAQDITLPSDEQRDDPEAMFQFETQQEEKMLGSLVEVVSSDIGKLEEALKITENTEENIRLITQANSRLEELRDIKKDLTEELAEIKKSSL